MTNHDPTTDGSPVRRGHELPAAASTQALRTLLRVVEGEESPTEWRAFVEDADRTPALWRDLAIQQREARLLGEAVDGAAGAAGLAALGAATASIDATPALRQIGPRVMRPGQPGWMGWSLAACLAGAWGLSSMMRPDAAPPYLSDAPSITRAALVTPEEARRHYLEVGREQGVVVGELPGKPLLERRKLPDGGFEVIYLRQIVERIEVPELFEFSASDDAGEFVPVPVRRGDAGSI